MTGIVTAILDCFSLDWDDMNARSGLLKAEESVAIKFGSFAYEVVTPRSRFDRGAVVLPWVWTPRQLAERG